MKGDPIALHAAKAPAALAAVCHLLRSEIDRTLPKSPSRIWYAMPVWFVGENAIVGYKVAAQHVNLLFWNGQAFGDPALKAAGKFKAAQIQFTDAAQVDLGALRRWLKRAGADVWDLHSIRAARSRTA
jgi:uncharacterized protein YdhG (YjbR/CyaY superfamily)